MNTHFNLDETFLLCALLFKIDVIVDIFEVMIVFARIVGDMLLCARFTFTLGLLVSGVDSAELLIGESEGMCCCLREMALEPVGGGDGVIERDSVRRV